MLNIPYSRFSLRTLTRFLYCLAMSDQFESRRAARIPAKIGRPNFINPEVRRKNFARQFFRQAEGRHWLFLDRAMITRLDTHARVRVREGTSKVCAEERSKIKKRGGDR